jgi:hypothetical protein
MGIVTEIVFLFVVAILHNPLPDIAGTLGISLVAALQMVSFRRQFRGASVSPALRVRGGVHRLWHRRCRWRICNGGLPWRC